MQLCLADFPSQREFYARHLLQHFLEQTGYRAKQSQYRPLLCGIRFTPSFFIIRRIINRSYQPASAAAARLAIPRSSAVAARVRQQKLTRIAVGLVARRFSRLRANTRQDRKRMLPAALNAARCFFHSGPPPMARP